MERRLPVHEEAVPVQHVAADALARRRQQLLRERRALLHGRDAAQIDPATRAIVAVALVCLGGLRPETSKIVPRVRRSFVKKDKKFEETLALGACLIQYSTTLGKAGDR